MKHMLPVIDNVIKNDIKPMLWDDMLRNWQLEDLKSKNTFVNIYSYIYMADR